MQKIRLQGIGWYNAVEAKSVIIGDTIIHNFGETSDVVSILPSKSGKTINYTVRCNNGKLYERKTTPNRLFAVKRVN